jgi:hypothetical protein
MKHGILSITLLFGFQLTLLAQKLKSDPASPKEDIHVNREYDENGNLIKFDSAYSYSWLGDTTMLKSFPPGNITNPFGDHFGFIPDSTFFGNSFFDDFDHLFFDPFNDKKDSIMNLHGVKRHFHNFQFWNDSTTSNLMDIDDFLRQFNRNKNDSISSESPYKMPFQSHSKSMDDMMKMLQQQIQDMRKNRQKFFEEQPDWKEF